MAKLNLSQAAKAVGKNRTTIWRHVNTGKLSIERDREGLPLVDTSELIRVYGEISLNATADAVEVQHQATPSYDDLIATIDLLRSEQAEMREQLSSLTFLIGHNKSITSTTEEAVASDKAENDPSWPAEIKSLEDISVRDEIRKKYSQTR